VTGAVATNLVAGTAGEAAFSVQNTGAVAATNLVATVSMPPGVFFDGVAAGSPWTCDAAHGANATVTCRLTALAAGARGDLRILARAQDSNANGRQIVIQSFVGDGGLSVGPPQPFTTITIA
jgi:hypothetical protein